MEPKGAQGGSKMESKGAKRETKYDKNASKNRSSGKVAKSSDFDAKKALASLKFWDSF